MTDLQQILDEGVAQIVSADAAPGVTAAITDRTSIVASSTAGVRVDGETDAIQIDDLMHIGSCTKAFTATVVGQAVDAGMLEWDTTLGDVLPNVHEGRATATLIHVLSHSAGFAPYEEDDQIATLPSLPDDPVEARRALAEYVAAEDLVGAVGTEFVYSNAGFGVAASIAERATGIPWEDSVRDLFAQVGIHGALGWPGANGGAVQGHLTEDGVRRPHDPFDDYQLEGWIAPAGDISLSAPAACAWMRANLDGLAGVDSIMRPDTWQTIHTPHGRAGLGWGVQDLAGQPASVHSGSAGTFLTLIVLLRSSELGIVINANAGDESAEGAAIELLKRVVVAVG